MVDLRTLRNLFDREQRLEMVFPDMQKEVSPEVVRFVRPKPYHSFILYTRLDAANADRVIHEQQAAFAERDLVFNWKVYDHDEPADLKERLRAQRFLPTAPDAVMALDLSEAPPALLAAPAVVVRRLTDSAQLQAVVQVEEAVWGDNFGWIHQRLGSHMQQPGYLSVFVAYIAERPVGAAWVYFHADSQFADLWGGSTTPDARRQGIYTALLAARAQEALTRGCRYLVVDASEMSRPILAQHGFCQLTTATDYTWSPDSSFGDGSK